LTYLKLFRLICISK